MKRGIKRILIILLMAALPFLSIGTASAMAFPPPDAPNQPPEQSREELFQDITISFLMPYIENEIGKHYSTYLAYPPMVAPYMVTVLYAERPDGYRTFFFRLKLQVESYVGPHESVGRDCITVTVSGSGDVKIVNFEHIKSYELPQRYEDIIRRGYRNPIP